MKTCGRCKAELPLACFPLDASRRDGRYPRCKVCRNGRGGLPKVIQWSSCGYCGNVFSPRHNKGRYVQHCSHACATEAGSFSGDRNGQWVGAAAGYYPAHMRLAKARGPASSRPCSQDCGKTASQWAYDHRDADERTEDDGMSYSLKPEHYVALCVSCHKRFDLARLKGDHLPA